MEGLNPALSLIVPFIGLIFLVGLCESVVKFLLEEILRLDYKAEQVIGYILTGIIAYNIARFANYRFLAYLDIEFIYPWMDWLMSGLIIAAGSNFLEKKFDFMNKLPHIVGGVFASAKGERKNKDNEPKG